MTRQHFGLVSSVVTFYHNRLKEDSINEMERNKQIQKKGKGKLKR